MENSPDIKSNENQFDKKKAFYKAYLEICDRYRLDFNYDEEGHLSVDPVPVDKNFMSLKLFSEHMLGILNEP